MRQVKNAGIAALIFSLAAIAEAANTAPKGVSDLADRTLTKYGVDPVIVEAVRSRNQAGKTLGEIKATDERWRAEPKVSDFMRSLMESECGTHLQVLQKTHPYLAEIFVMDNLGANVCMTNRTSDYWQGDEAKFIESYKGGSGAIHIGDVEFDDSAQASLVQVSVPVRDGDTVIGAMTFGIRIDRMPR
ncbi:MAG: PDC sensor domain-containing protein [Pseudomonadota bacterium]|nr:PDC sensor domain-containing protein [Pseudomonadota bacterium]